MERIKANGREFEVYASGNGEPVLLIHGSLIGADAFAAMAGEQALSGYRLIRYNRRGYCGSTPHTGPCSIADQARDAAGILASLNVERAHIAGHSFGAFVALQLAHDAPALVNSISLLESVIFTVPSAAAFDEAVVPVFQAYESGDRAEAVDRFCRLVAGEDYRTRMQIPGTWFEQAVADLDGMMQVEFPSEQEWHLEDIAGGIRQPIFSLLGEESAPLFRESHARIGEVFPGARLRTVPNCTHGLQIMNPAGVASALADFFATCPVAATAR